MVKNSPANAVDRRDAGSIPGWEDPLEEGMATHSSVLAWKNPMVRGAWQATVHRVTKSHDLRDLACLHARTHDILLTVYTIQIHVHRAVSHGLS